AETLLAGAASHAGWLRRRRPPCGRGSRWSRDASILVGVSAGGLAADEVDAGDRELIARIAREIRVDADRVELAQSVGMRPRRVDLDHEAGALRHSGEVDCAQAVLVEERVVPLRPRRLRVLQIMQLIDRSAEAVV